MRDARAEMPTAVKGARIGALARCREVSWLVRAIAGLRARLRRSVPPTEV